MPQEIAFGDLRPIAAGEVQVLARKFVQAELLQTHTHELAQILFASHGLMQVTTPKGRWLVPPQRAVWIPPATMHSIEILTGLEMRTVYIQPARVAEHAESSRLGHEFVVAVSDLLRDLILAFFTEPVRSERVELLARLTLFELVEAEDPTTFMPMPTDSRVRRVAELALADVRGRRDLPDLAHEAGVSQRTVARIFPLETNLTFKKWRQRVRMMAAIEELGRGQVLIKQVSAKLGYSSVAAFAAAFHEVLGETPSEFQARCKTPHVS